MVPFFQRGTILVPLNKGHRFPPKKKGKGRPLVKGYYISALGALFIFVGIFRLGLHPTIRRNKLQCRQIESCLNGSSCPSRQSEIMYHVGIGVEVVSSATLSAAQWISFGIHCGIRLMDLSPNFELSMQRTIKIITFCGGIFSGFSLSRHLSHAVVYHIPFFHHVFPFYQYYSLEM